MYFLGTLDRNSKSKLHIFYKNPIPKKFPKAHTLCGYSGPIYNEQNFTEKKLKSLDICKTCLRAYEAIRVRQQIWDKLSEDGREALKKSIKKWERIVKGKGTDKGPHNCALCKFYHNHKQPALFKYWCINDGEKCPIFQATGRKSCNRSPYEKWEKHHELEHQCYDSDPLHIECEKCLELAIHEWAFLKSFIKEKS